MVAPGANSCSSSSLLRADFAAAEKCHPGEVAFRPIEGGNEAKLDRIGAGREHDRDGCSRLACRDGRSRTAAGRDHRHPVLHQIGHHRWQSVILTFHPAVIDRRRPCRRRSPLRRGLCGRRPHGRRTGQASRRGGNRPPASPLLRARRKRPRRRRAAEQHDEFAPFHSITSSASASSVGGMSRPSVFAVLRLMTNSNLVDCITGRSAGFSPLRMRPA